MTVNTSCLSLDEEEEAHLTDAIILHRPQVVVNHHHSLPGQVEHILPDNGGGNLLRSEGRENQMAPHNNSSRRHSLSDRREQQMAPDHPIRRHSVSEGREQEMAPDHSTRRLSLVEEADHTFIFQNGDNTYQARRYCYHFYLLCCTSEAIVFGSVSSKSSDPILKIV